jgi:hypothetical protein
MSWIVKGRYTDTPARARRSEPLSAAAEMQWDLLPPLTCATDEVAISGVLAPAYAIGGDSFDYAFDTDRVDFAMVDAIGHGMPAVLMSSSAINSLRNSRRTGLDLVVRLRDRRRHHLLTVRELLLRHRHHRHVGSPDQHPELDQRRPRPPDARAQR